MKTTLPWYSGLQLLPSYIYDPWLQDMIKSVVSFLQLFQSVSEKCGREKYVLISWAPQQETWIKYESILCGLAE